MPWPACDGGRGSHPRDMGLSRFLSFSLFVDEYSSTCIRVLEYSSVGRGGVKRFVLNESVVDLWRERRCFQTRKDRCASPWAHAK